ncbi:hypothetical protein FIBSPDRAFT_1027453 [Athelia psychrophila]|uniref:RING-type domain-containing protein n=1 Tax=Athelia psychrophila TaxID=1759441 RepID=A0A166H8X5_9AGAM|nr:hypothetical protein FIBSPDRAFT_1027453 [Fibularhizoctonia sp. CBS 109695]
MDNHDVKACPGCKACIERIAGCNHMACTRCQTHMCWECSHHPQSSSSSAAFTAAGATVGVMTAPSPPCALSSPSRSDTPDPLDWKGATGNAGLYDAEAGGGDESADAIVLDTPDSSTDARFCDLVNLSPHTISCTSQKSDSQDSRSALLDLLPLLAHAPNPPSHVRSVWPLRHASGCASSHRSWSNAAPRSMPPENPPSLVTSTISAPEGSRVGPRQRGQMARLEGDAQSYSSKLCPDRVLGDSILMVA